MSYCLSLREGFVLSDVFYKNIKTYRSLSLSCSSKTFSIDKRWIFLDLISIECHVTLVYNAITLMSPVIGGLILIIVLLDLFIEVQEVFVSYELAQSFFYLRREVVRNRLRQFQPDVCRFMSEYRGEEISWETIKNEDSGDISHFFDAKDLLLLLEEGVRIRDGVLIARTWHRSQEGEVAIEVSHCSYCAKCQAAGRWCCRAIGGVITDGRLRAVLIDRLTIYREYRHCAHVRWDGHV